MTASPPLPPTAIVFAYHDVGVRCLAALLEAGIQVKHVVTHRDNPDETIWFASVAELAAARGLSVLMPEDANAPAVVEQLRADAPDFIFSFYYRQMLNREVLDLARRGAYNMHGSLLPRYRGRVPINWAILKGETETGATLHEMVEKPDAGRIVGQQSVPIGPDETAVEVFRKVTEAAAGVLTRCLPGLIDGTARLTPQDLKAGSYFGGRKPADGIIDWSMGAVAIHNLVRAVAPPYPGAFTTVMGQPLKIHRTRLAPERFRHHNPGFINVSTGRCIALCGDGRMLHVEQAEYRGQALDEAALSQALGVGVHPLG